MPNAATKLHEMTGEKATSGRSPGREILEEVPDLGARSQLRVFQNLTPELRTEAQAKFGRRSVESDLTGDRQTVEHRLAPHTPGHDRLLNARQVAERLGVSERWVRDHTTRRVPKIRAVKLGTLIRYRWTDVEAFMESLDTFRISRHPRFGV
jgi:excisionase family DNA binding protein